MFFPLTDIALFAEFRIGLELLKLLLFASSLWLIFLILIQRGKGGGLSAALGGGGGDSAFGAKAGDAFTKITIFSAIFWIGLCMVTIAWYNPPERATNRFVDDEEVYSEVDDSGSSAPSMGAPGMQGDDSAEGSDDESTEDASSEGSGDSLEPVGESTEPAGESTEPADAAEGGQ